MESIKKKRTAIRSSCTKLSNKVLEELNFEDINISRVEVYVDQLKGTLRDIDNLNDQILESIEETEDYEHEYDNNNDYALKIKETVNKAERWIRKEDDNKSVASIVSQTQARVVNLPQIKLPYFDNTVAGWNEFYDCFKAAVHDREDLSEVQKFTYLKGQLKGDALTLVKSLPSTSASYRHALEILRVTYSNKVVGTLQCVKKLSNLKIPAHTLESVRSFHADLECIIASLALLEYSIEGNKTAEAIIIALLVNKMPKSLTDSLFRTAHDKILSLSQFRQAINVEMTLLCSAGVSNEKETNSFNFRENLNSKHVDRRTASFATTNQSRTNAVSNERSTRRTFECVFCGKAHSSSSCDKYTNLQDRRSRLKVLQRCWHCMMSNHHPAPCKDNIRCFECNERHVVGVCPVRLQQKMATNRVPSSETHNISVSENEINDSTDEIYNGNLTASSHINSNVALPALVVPVFKSDDCKETVKLQALLDQGSQRSFILKDIVYKYNLPVFGKESLKINTISECGSETVYDTVKIKLDRPGKPVEIVAIVVNKLPQIVNVGNLKDLTESFRSQIPMVETRLETDGILGFELLIGGDYYYRIVNIHETVKFKNGMHLLPTHFGHVITGKIKPGSSMLTGVTSAVTTLNISFQEGEAKPWDNTEKLWMLDSIGIVEDKSISDIDVYSKFKEGIKYENDHYVVKLPWRENVLQLPSNFAMAKARLSSSVKQLVKTGMLQKYEDIFQEQIKAGFIEKVPINQLKNKSHYIPHLPVIKDHHSTPVRIVYDCSAKAGTNVSLNDCLHSGPQMVPEITEVLLRLRRSKFLCASDISKAFLCVGISEEDRDFTRFLWLEDPSDTNSPLISYRFKVVLFGATSSPFLLQGTIRYHISQYEPEHINKDDLVRNLYVDNLHYGSDNQEDLLKFFHESIKCYEQAGLPLREWVSNSPELNKLAKAQNMFSTVDTSAIKILGIMWNTKQDTLFLNTSQLSKDTMTKRKLLSDSAKIYDPLGLFFPITIRSRMLIQQLWKSKMEWDDPVDNEVLKKWKKLVADLEQLPLINIPRWIIKTSVVSLHIFSDASALAYGCCAYVGSKGEYNLLMAKARVAPLKDLTIPKLELTAATLSIRVASYIKKSFSEELLINNIHLWLDSKVALCWLTQKSEHKNIYVRNRVHEAQKKLPEAIYHYVPTENNPADMLTRDSRQELDANVFWWQGPDLLKSEDKWIKFDPHDQNNVSVMIGLLSDESDKKQMIKPNEGLPSCKRFSSLPKLLRVTSYVNRFVNFKSRPFSKLDVEIKELKRAEKQWLVEMQKVSYADEMLYLTGQTKIKTSLIKQLWLKLEDGLIKVHSRLQNANLSQSVLNPILLSPDHDLIPLLVMDSHVRTLHGSVPVVMMHLRQRFWLPRCRQVVKKIIKECSHCKRQTGDQYNIPISPPLPLARVSEAIPFQFTGIDYSGAMTVKTAERTGEKRYIALFTCLSTRAIHLELAEDNSAEAFVRVFRRFVARKSVPRCIYSDRGSNFIGFIPQLEEIQSHPKVRDLLQYSQTEWKLIPARSPHFGGAWERLIGVTKRTIHKVLGNAYITADELHTVITEVECRINNRPLTYVNNEDENIPLTPAHLMWGRGIDELPTEVDEEEFQDNHKFDHTTLSRRHRRLINLINEAWSRWKTEYLLALRERDRVAIPGNVQGEIQAKNGDIILYRPDGKTGPLKLGRILKIITGLDGKSRVAQIKTSHGETFRALSHLYHLEGSPEIINKEVSEVKSSKSVDNESLDPLAVDQSREISESPKLKRPKRAAAAETTSKIAKWACKGFI